MIHIRRSEERGRHREDWLESRHTFSFHTYYDPAHMGFRGLRVINEDRVAPETGFGMHPHDNMEIVSLVLSGQLQHRDNLGNVETIGPYELQRITAGKGIMHSEVNPGSDEEVHFFQIWLLPREQGLEAGYEIRRFAKRPPDALTLLVSPDGRESSAVIQQDVSLYLGNLGSQKRLEIELEPGRHGWLQLASGEIALGSDRLEAGDGAAISDEGRLEIRAERDAEFLFFDLN